MQPRVLILRAPGTNCDRETAFAFETAGARAEPVHLNRLLEKPALAGEYQMLCIPGGFSYGDDICAGRIFGNQMRHHLRDTLLAVQRRRQADPGHLQRLSDSDQERRAPARPSRRADRHAHAERQRQVRGPLGAFARGESANACSFGGIEQMYLPVAHAEGKFVARDEATLLQSRRRGQLVLRYAADSLRNPERG